MRSTPIPLDIPPPFIQDASHHQDCIELCPPSKCWQCHFWQGGHSYEHLIATVTGWVHTCHCWQIQTVSLDYWIIGYCYFSERFIPLTTTAHCSSVTERFSCDTQVMDYLLEWSPSQDDGSRVELFDQKCKIPADTAQHPQITSLLFHKCYLLDEISLQGMSSRMPK